MVDLISQPLPGLRVFALGLRDYSAVWQQMKLYTDSRTQNTPDELWLVQHPPVFTQGQAGKVEHLLACGDIPVVQSDRGGQVTYHGPGQLVAYPLINLRRLGLGVRDLVTRIENSVIEFLAPYNIEAVARADAPGVYVEGRKIASLGLRVRKGCSFHGVAININLDLSPFERINPCGYAGLEMVRLQDLVAFPLGMEEVAKNFALVLANQLGLEPEFMTELPMWAQQENE